MEGKMAKPTKYAPLICIIITIIAILSVLYGIGQMNSLFIIIPLLPAIIYEIYRTEGSSTKFASWFLFFVLLGELALIIFKINFNLAEYLQTEEKTVSGYLIPLGDIKTLGPILLAIGSVMLFTKTYGIYTKWLAVIIFISAFSIIYTLDPIIFKDLLRSTINSLFNKI